MLIADLLCILVAAGVTGAFGQTFLAEQGYIPGYQTSLVVTVGIAAAYAGLQFAYLGLVRLLKPTRSPLPYFLDALSQVAVAAFLPRLLQMDIAWPHPMLVRIEPLIFVGAFLLLHGFGKLVAFFAVLQGAPSGRGPALAWLTAACLTAFVTAGAYHNLQGALEASRPQSSAAIDLYAANGQVAQARVVPERASVGFEIPDAANLRVAFRFAQVASDTDTAERVDGVDGVDAPVRIHVTVAIEGQGNERYVNSVDLPADGWAQLTVPAEDVPAQARRGEVTWSAQREPAWQTITGLRPVTVSDAKMLVAGPYFHAQRTAESPPNVVVIMADGVGAEHVQSLGYGRKTTPNLDQLAAGGSLFEAAYPPAPEPMAAAMSLMTGLHPLTHGLLGRQHGPLAVRHETLAEGAQAQHYATAAFTEGDGGLVPDLTLGTGIERGFELFDASYVPHDAPVISSGAPQAVSSEATLLRAQEWIGAHATATYFAFIRLRDAAEIRDRPRANRFRDGGGPADAVDRYDAGIADLDELLGRFFNYLRETGLLANTVVVFTSSHGYDFGTSRTGTPYINLTESSLRVPLVIAAPKASGGRFPDPAGIEGVAPLLRHVMGQEASAWSMERLVSETLTAAVPVAVMGDPLVLSMRRERWRFIWPSGQPAFRPARPDDGGAGELLDLDRQGQWGARRDWSDRYPEIAAALRDQLRDWLRPYQAQWEFAAGSSF